MSGKKLGIDNLKNAVLAIIGFGNHMTDVFKDGKFTLPEAFGFAGNLALFPKSKEEWQQVKDELADLDTEERHELQEYVISKSLFVNEEIDQCIDEGVEMVGNMYDWIEKWFLNKKKTA